MTWFVLLTRSRVLHSKSTMIGKKAYLNINVLCSLLQKERLPPGVNESWFMGMIAAVGVRIIDKEMELST
ncbi:hypothetical protein BDV30DRAFT_221963 [Aspergillus minisclerotigenes]|uniref:Uncharacterized protein n=1 Tax=Aspergillus minisclerotigenes TaxID=656917 RepID=A0A5N6IJ55_9EURO|nr:hypothetical protein BDV30DRAFT_221963 [Aspergillus minisclerotigenes]